MRYNVQILEVATAIPEDLLALAHREMSHRGMIVKGGMIGLMGEVVMEVHGGIVDIVSIHRFVVQVVDEMFLVCRPCLSVCLRRQEAWYSVRFKLSAQLVRRIA